MILPVCFKAKALCSSRILAASFHFSVHSRVSSLSWASLTASFLAKLLFGSLESKSVVSEVLSLSISLRSSRINFTFGSSLTVGLLIMFLARLAQRRVLKDYGNIGCLVFMGGIQNLKIFGQKLNTMLPRILLCFLNRVVENWASFQIKINCLKIEVVKKCQQQKCATKMILK